MATRTTTKSTASTTVAQPAKPIKAGGHPRVEEIHAAQVDGDEFDNQSFREFFSELWTMLGLPSARRSIAAFVLGLAVSTGIGYVIGKVVAATMLGIVALTGSMFLFWLTAALGIILASWVGAKCGMAVAKWIASGRSDEQFREAKAKVTGWFTR